MYQKSLSGNILIEIENLHTPAKQYRAKIYQDNNFCGSVIFVPNELTGHIISAPAIELAHKVNYSRIIDLVKEIRLAIEEMYVSQPLYESEPEIFMVHLIQQLEHFNHYLQILDKNNIAWENTKSYEKFIEHVHTSYELNSILFMLSMTSMQNMGSE